MLCNGACEAGEIDTDDETDPTVEQLILQPYCHCLLHVYNVAVFIRKSNIVYHFITCNSLFMYLNTHIEVARERF